MTELTLMRNIGKELERKLKIIGINSAEDLKKIGSKEAFFKYPFTLEIISSCNFWVNSINSSSLTPFFNLYENKK